MRRTQSTADRQNSASEQETEGDKRSTVPDASREPGPLHACDSAAAIQPKVMVNEPGDRYEKEAKRVADAVMRMPKPSETAEPQEMLLSDRIQRMCPHCRRHARQGKPRNCEECEQGLQRRRDREVDATISDSVEEAAEVTREPGRSLSEPTKSFFESRMGANFGGVRVHTGAEADRAARSINARAYTLGSDLVFRSGEFRPDTREGKRLLAHELTHTIQQNTNSNTRIFAQRQDTENEGTPTSDIAGTPCTCSDESRYSEGTIAFIWAIGNSVKRFSSQYGVPEPAVAGAIADEYETQDIVDAFQEYSYQARGETRLETEQYLDIKTGYDKADKLMNVLENDIGPGNIKIRTALKIKREEIANKKGKNPENVDISLTDLIDELMTPSGTSKYAAAYIARAKAKFSDHENFKEYPGPAAETIYVSYYKQGESYYADWAKGPSDPPCPGSGGCRFYTNRDRIVEALAMSPRIIESE